MKKILSLSVALLLILGLTIPAFATGPTVTFTDDSLPEVGGTLTVDKYALLDNGSITSEMYNALLEGNVIYSWYKNGTITQEGIGAEGISYEITLSDQGCTIYVKVSFYEDDGFQESKKCGEAFSNEVTIIGPAPEIITKSITDAIVGKEYYVKLECSDPDAVFSEIMGSQLSDFGLYLTQHGEIEGTPTKAGNCHINILAVSEGGGEVSVSFDLIVKAEEISIQTTPTTIPVTKPDSVNTVPPEAPPAETQTEIHKQMPTVLKEEAFPWWGYAVILLCVIAVQICIAFLFIILKRNKRTKK